MSLDEVKRKIIDMANERVRVIREEAAERGRVIIKENEAHIKQMLRSGRKRYDRKAELQKGRREGVARVEARNRHLDAKQEMIEGVIQEGRNKILALPDDEYLGLMEKLFASANIPECPCDVQISQVDAKRITPGFLKSVEERLSKEGNMVNLTLSDTWRDDIEGGFILRTGQMEIDCSLGAIIRMKRSEMEREAAQILFGG